jgi:hypothetical protein
MMSLYALNTLRWYARLPIKWAVLGLTVLVVCFPYPGRLVRHLQHCRDPNALIEPDAPALQPLVEELRSRLSDDLKPRDALKRVERFVYEKIPYEWDWNTWGTADYLPTVTEVIEMGKEDCDGQAVLAASLLRCFGFNARLVNNFSHMWVRTDQGDTMSPGAKPVIVSTDEGPQFHLEGLTELPRGLAFGIAVFPLLRELIILGVMWLLLLRRGGGILPSIVGLALLIAGLFLLRAGSKEYGDPKTWMQLLGLAGLTAGAVVLLLWARFNARRAERLEAVRTAERASDGGGL